MELFCKKIIFQFLGYCCSSKHFYCPLHIQSSSTGTTGITPAISTLISIPCIIGESFTEVQTSLTWLNKTPLRVPEWHPPKNDREMQTFFSWIPLVWRKQFVIINEISYFIKKNTVYNSKQNPPF